MNEDLLREIKSTLPWLVAAALAVGGFYTVKNYRASRKAQASEAFVSAYTAEELEEAVSKFGGSDAGGVLKLRLAKKYYDTGRFQEAMDLYSSFGASGGPVGFADVPAVGMAQCREALGDFAAAAADFEAFADANPSSYLALTARLGAARCAAQAGDSAKALAKLKEIAQSVKGDSLAEARVKAVEDCVKRFVPRK